MKAQKFLTYAVLVIMFCVAVSGGCGGGSSNHYYGNYGNSSQDVTPEPESQDVVPENPVSGDDYGDDDYGVNNGVDSLRKFKLLNNSVWQIEKIEVYGDGKISRTEGCEVMEGLYNHPTDTIGLITNNDSIEMWFDENNLGISEDLTIRVIDPDDGTEQTITILRATGGFKVERGFEKMYNSAFITYIPRNDGTNKNDEEHIYCQKMVGDFAISDVTYLLNIKNTCKGSNGREYFTFFYLTRIDLDNWQSNGASVYSEVFKKLSEPNTENATSWKILSVDVVGASGKSKDYPIKNNTYNYNVNKITLMTNWNDNDGDLSGGLTWLDGNGNLANINMPLTIQFTDKTKGFFTHPTYSIPLLTSDHGFKYKGIGKDDDDTVEYQTTLSNGNTETIFQHNWDSNPFLRINHSFNINGAQYSANMVLVPYLDDF